jgi:predicted permease
VFDRILGIILPVFLIVLVGYFYARRVKPDMAMVNRISMTILAPALIFSALASKDFSIAANAPLMLGSIGIVLGSGLLAWPFARLLHVDHRTFVPPMMFNNCGNIGLPLAVLAYGQPGFSAMVALFTISNLLHFTLGAWMIDHHARMGNLLRNPMVWSTFLGFAFAAVHPPMPEWGSVAIRMVGDALIPMMLLSLGVRLYEVRWNDWHLGVIGGLVCPLTGIAIAALLGPVLRLDPMQQGLLIIFGSLPPAVLNFMVAEQFRQEPAKVASIVLIGNVMSAAFIPLGLAIALH